MSNEINVGAISEALNNKVDLNQLNTNEQGLEYVSGLSMPSDRYVDLTLGASGSTYTAPANGYYYLAKASTGASQYLALGNTTTDMTTALNCTASGQTMKVFLPVKSGQQVMISYNLGGSSKFRFIYAEGAE